MQYKLQDIINMELFQNLQDRLNEIYSFPSAIIDNEGNILTATAWQDICTKFYRQNKESEKECIKSDQYILEHLAEANPAVSYRCPHGLVDNATPIIIEDIHYGNYFTGQFFLEKPDLKFFRAQAQKYGFDEEAYIEAVIKVPIWTQEQLNSYLFFIKGLIAIISESGLKKLQEIEHRKQLEENEARASAILETAMDGFWLVDIQGRLLEVNESYCRMSGYSMQELLSMSIPDLEANESATATAVHIKKTITQGEDRFDSKHRRKDGSVFDVEVSVQYRPIDGGRLIAFLRDFTDRKLAEGAVRESERHYRELFDQTNEGLMIMTEDGQLSQVNRAFAEMHGYTVDALNKMDIRDLDSLRERTLEDRADIIRRLKSGEIVRFEVEHYHMDGHIFPLTVTTSMIYLEDKTFFLAFHQDITERKRAETALLESEQNFRILADSGQALIWTSGTDKLCFYFNRPWLEFTGRTLEQELGNGWVEGVHPDDMQQCFNVYVEAFERREKFSMEYRLRRHDGEYRWLLDDGCPRYNVQNNFIGYIGHCLDITERKRTEELLRDSEQRFLNAFEYAAIGMALVSPEGTFLKVNKSLCNFLGYTAEELTVLKFQDITHPDDIETDLKYVHQMLTGEITTYQMGKRYFGKRGTVVSTLLSVSLVWDERNRPKYFISQIQDITERKQAEESLRESEARFRLMFDQSPVGKVIVSLDGRFIQTNEAFGRFIGYGNDELLSRGLEDITHPDEILFDLEQLHRLKMGEIEQHSRDKRYIRKDGEMVWGHLSSRLLKDTAGKPLYFLAGVNDITERKRTEAEREKLEAQLLQAQKMEAVGRLAGGVAHDFNNALAVILMEAEMALMLLNPSDPLYTSLEEIQKAGKRSADLTRQLLAFARKQMVKPTVLDLNVAVEGMLKMLRRLIGEDIALSWNPSHDIYPIKIDPSQVDQILANLCVNARDAISDVGKVTIETANAVFDDAYCTDHAGYMPGEYALLSVSDNGCGMDKATIMNVFEPFFTTKEFGKGTGLGLSTVYGAVKQNNRFINIYSEIGQGTTFRIYLPRYGEKTTQNDLKGSSIAVTGGLETILLVEDDLPILNLGKAILEKLGYTVMAASTPGEAIRLADEYSGQIHLLITDVVMPEMNGRDLAKNLLSRYPHLKRLFMSGYTADVIVHRCVLDEGVHFIQKPFSIKDLAAKVRKALEQ